MSAFTVTMLQAITIGIGLAIGYFFNKSSLKLWRVFVGFLVGFVVSWVAGVILWAFVFMSRSECCNSGRNAKIISIRHCWWLHGRLFW